LLPLGEKNRRKGLLSVRYQSSWEYPVLARAVLHKRLCD